MPNTKEEMRIRLLIRKLHPSEKCDWYETATAIHAQGNVAIQPLIDALADREIRPHAISALSLFRADAAPAIPYLLPFLQSDFSDLYAAQAARQTLLDIGKPVVEPIIERMSDADDQEFRWYRSILENLDPDDVMPAVLKCLDSIESTVRRRACLLLVRVSRRDHDPTSKLMEQLLDPDADVRNAAASALSNSPVEQVLAAFASTDAVVREGCVKALARNGSFCGSDGPKFFHEALGDMAPLVRIAAADGLLQASAQIARKRLDEEMNSDDLHVRAEAVRICRRHRNVECMNWLGQKVSRLLEDQDSTVRREAAATVLSVGWSFHATVTRTAARVFCETIRDRSIPHRDAYIRLLGQNSPEKETLIAALRECLHDSDLSVVVAAVGTLGAFKVADQSIIAEIASFLESPNFNLREAAVRAVGDIGLAAATQTLPRLRSMLRSGDLIEDVLNTLETFGPAAEPALAEVVSAIGKRTEIAPYVLASIGTREAVLELAKSISTYGHGDRKDFDASQGALCRIADRAKPKLVAEFDRAKPGEYDVLLAGLQTIVEPDEFAGFVVRALDRGNADDRRRALLYIKYHDVPTHFVKLPGAIDRLVSNLDDANVDVRITALEAFASCNESFPVLADAYRDRIVTSFRRSSAEASADHQIDSLKKAAEKLRLEISGTQ